MALSVYQDYLGRPLKIGPDGELVPYVERPVKAPKLARPARAPKKPPAAIDGDPESATGRGPRDRREGRAVPGRIFELAAYRWETCAGAWRN